MLVDIDALKDSIHSTDLFVLGFQGFSKRLLIDTRSNHRAELLLTIVEHENLVASIRGTKGWETIWP
jgi:hypothetical protein